MIERATPEPDALALDALRIGYQNIAQVQALMLTCKALFKRLPDQERAQILREIARDGERILQSVTDDLFEKNHPVDFATGLLGLQRSAFDATVRLLGA